MIFVTGYVKTDGDPIFNGPSVDSGYKTLQDVLIAMGGRYLVKHEGMLIYGDDTNRVMFTMVRFSI